MSIAQLTEGAGVTRQAVTKHLRTLEQVRLIRGAQSGRETVWQLTPKGLAGARRHLDGIAAQWDRALHRLKAAVERGS
jgi:DNA-binding MarR family transcriptional regulator